MDWADFLHADCDAIIVGIVVSILASWHLSGCFLGTGSLDFSGFCQGASNHYEVVHDNQIFLKNLFCLQNWGNGQKMNLEKNLVINFHCICCIMNMFMICCVSAQNLCLGKILSLTCRPKYSQPIKLHNF